MRHLGKCFIVLFVMCVAWGSTYSWAGISANLAKKCRQMMVNAHPPQPFTHSNYGQAERSYFNTCISHNGHMPQTTGSGRQSGSQPKARGSK